MPAVVRLPAPRKKTETDISREIRTALDKLGIPNFRMQSGGYRGRAKGLPKGTPDMLVAPNCALTQVPFFLWLEVKKPGELPTAAQLAFADRVRNRGHYWLCVNSLDDVLMYLRQGRAR